MVEFSTTVIVILVPDEVAVPLLIEESEDTEGELLVDGVGAEIDDGRGTGALEVGL